MEGADEVLAARVVDGDLAAHGSVDLREEGRRHLNHRQAAHERRSREAGQVAHDAAADGHDRRVAVQAVATNPSHSRSASRRLLLSSPSGTTKTAGSKPAPRRLFVTRAACGCDGGLRDDGRPAPQPKLGARRSGRVEETRSDLDRVAPSPEVHHDLPHRLASLYLAKKKNRCRSDFGYVLRGFQQRADTRFSDSRMSNRVSWI